MADTPRHYYLHSLKSLNLLAEKYGLKIEKIKYLEGPVIFEQSEKLKRNILISDKINFTKEESCHFKKERKRLKEAGQTGLACFYLSLK